MKLNGFFNKSFYDGHRKRAERIHPFGVPLNAQKEWLKGIFVSHRFNNPVVSHSKNL